MSTERPDKLRECPFNCGNDMTDEDAWQFGWTNFGSVYVECNGCDAQGPAVKTKADLKQQMNMAMHSWNGDIFI